MDRATRPGVNPFARLGEYLVRHSGKVILAGAVITLLLMIPLIALSPTRMRRATLAAMCSSCRTT